MTTELVEVLRSLNKMGEFIFVDDGLTDGSFKALKGLQEVAEAKVIIDQGDMVPQSTTYKTGF